MANGEEKRLDEQDLSALKQMAQYWRESKVGRRKVLATTLGAGLGVAAGGGYMAGKAEAGTASSGTYGSVTEVGDAYLEDIYDHNDNNPMSFPGDGSVSIDELTVSEIAAQISQSIDQSVSNNTGTTVAMDVDGGLPSGDVLTVDLANNKITINKNGVYLLKGSVGFDSPGDGTRIQINVKAAGSIEVLESNVSGGNDRHTVSASTLYEETNAPTDVICEVFQTSGGSLTTASDQVITNLNVVRLG